MGFCVARTKKGSVEPVLSPRTVTWLLLHRLEQRRLGLGRRAVDLVGEHHVGEDRPLMNRKTRWPVSVILRTSTSVPVMSLGMRSGVNWLNNAKYSRAKGPNPRNPATGISKYFRSCVKGAEYTHFDADQKFQNSHRSPQTKPAVMRQRNRSTRPRVCAADETAQAAVVGAVDHEQTAFDHCGELRIAVADSGGRIVERHLGSVGGEVCVAQHVQDIVVTRQHPRAEDRMEVDRVRFAHGAPDGVRIFTEGGQEGVVAAEERVEQPQQTLLSDEPLEKSKHLDTPDRPPSRVTGPDVRLGAQHSKG